MNLVDPFYVRILRFLHHIPDASVPPPPTVTCSQEMNSLPASAPAPVQPVPVRKQPKLFVSLDLETTGLLSWKHGIIQIGAWATGESEDDFRGYFVRDANPHIDPKGVEHPVVMDDEALAVNRFTLARIQAAPPLGEVLREFRAWLNRYTSQYEIVIVGSGVAFDIAWLKKDLMRYGLSTEGFRAVAEIMTLGFAVYGEFWGLGKLAKRLGIHNGGAHDALADAVTASKVFHRLTHLLTQPQNEPDTPSGDRWDDLEVLSPSATRDTKIHVTLQLDPELYKRIVKFRDAHGSKTTADTIERLVQQAIYELESQ